MAIVVALVRTNWSGTTGGPGLTQIAMESITDPHSWNASSAQTAVDAMRACWQGIASLLPDNIKLDVSPVVDVYFNSDGQLVGSHSAATTPTQVAGTSTAVFSMASGVKVNLNTGAIRNGRRVRGSTYIVPAASGAFNTDGLVLSGSRGTINGAFNAMRTTLAAANIQLCVWSRPIPEGKQYGPREGATTAVTGVETSEKGAILKGRRD